MQGHHLRRNRDIVRGRITVSDGIMHRFGMTMGKSSDMRIARANVAQAGAFVANAAFS